jgi:hypothetical protein
MDFAKLTNAVLSFEPEAQPIDVARMSLLLLGGVDSPDQLMEQSSLEKQMANLKLRLKATADQHAAMSEEIQSLACSDPRKFASDQVWVLVRAIKVQSQLLQLYTGDKQYQLG